MPTMEGIHGVDVSWLHQPNTKSDFHHHRSHAPSSPGLTRDVPPKTSSHGGLPSPPPEAPSEKPTAQASPQLREHPPQPSAAQTTTTTTRTPPRRPAILGRNSSDKLNSALTPPDQTKGRRGSWISSLSAKFSSSPTPLPQSQTPPPNVAAAKGPPNGGSPAPAALPTAFVTTTISSDGIHAEPEELLEPCCPQPPKSAASSFFSSALRRLSSSSQATPQPKVIPNGGVCPRKVMNVDPNRDRCLVPELDSAKLRRVAFCVDVEIASGPRYKDETEGVDKKKKSKDKKLKERGEGEALKHPETLAAEKDKDGQIQSTGEEVGSSAAPNPEGTIAPEEKKDVSKKKEKKKRSEAERKERKEKKRRKAEENGQIPLELSRDSEESSAVATPTGSSTPRPQDRPTTDPLRIYRRCCQLRETPILKRISDQLSQPSNCPIAEPGVVMSLDLTGSRLQLSDVVTLGDWLAVVPVKKLLFEDADLTNEGVRVVLAGLLAAKSPEVSRRRFHNLVRDKDEKSEPPKYEERAGVIEKLTLKNNPKIGKEGWKHIALFAYMCKSLRALDVSMIPFPKPPSIPLSSRHNAANGTPEKKFFSEQKIVDQDVSEIFAKAISERLGGSRLEELIMAECSLTTDDVRKIVDGVTISGLKRLGLAGNNLDDQGLDHVIRYVKSGICEGLDLGGNDVRESLGRLCDAFGEHCHLWALSLAACNLTPDSLRPLFPKLISLPQFKFLDLSHNHELFSTEPSAVCILRKYLPLLKTLKRIHLTDVSMSPAQAIALAEVLPEIPQLAHLNIMENPQLSAVAQASDEATQEEACALYASLMAAVRVSNSIIAIDVDVPAAETSEVVKALAKQVVAYCLRNMERWTAVDAAENGEEPPEPSGADKEVQVPEVLLHLVGQVEGFSENHDDDDPAPDDDYIVGGTGVVKALSYVLLERAADLRRGSLAPSGATTPKSNKQQSSEESTTKAWDMSKNLLGSARKIRTRLQPALAREAKAGDENAYRRLLFLDQTLQGIIKRFEDEYPETRVPESLSVRDSTIADSASGHSSAPSQMTDPSGVAASIATDLTQPDNDSDSDNNEPRGPSLHARAASDVSIASRALSLEEGRIHRLGQHLRQGILRAPASGTRSPADSRPSSSHQQERDEKADKDLRQHLDHLDSKFRQFREASGADILSVVQREGWDEVCRRVGQNVEELRALEIEHPEEYAKFRESQLAALANRGQRAQAELDQQKDEASGDSDVAVTD